MRLVVPAGLLLCCLVALWLRVPDLGQRPFHNDEAVNAIKFRALWEDGIYRYDPDEYHGPSLHYATLLLARTTGWGAFPTTQESDYRWVALLTGLGLIAGLWLVRDGLGRAGTVWAGVLTALSPGMVFFSRYFIHELLLLFGTLLLFGGLWRYWTKPGWAGALLAGIGLGLMHATKETFVLNLAAIGAAAAGCWLWRRAEANGPAEPSRVQPAHLALAVVAWLGVAGTLLTSFFQHPRGLLDSVLTYLPWLQRAAGDSPHIHPWTFYWERLFWFSGRAGEVWTELLLLVLALVAAVAALRRRGFGDAHPGWLRFILLYTVALAVIYTLIPYKTPWCILGVVQGLAMLGGVGLAIALREVRRPAWRLAVSLAAVLLLAHLGWQAWTLSHPKATARTNPWGYSATADDIWNLQAMAERVAAVHPRGSEMDVQVACRDDDYWPLPFMFRRFSNTGWWSHRPPAPLAPLLVVSPDVAAEIEEAGTHVNAGYFQLRFSVFRAIYVERRLWDEVVAASVVK